MPNVAPKLGRPSLRSPELAELICTLVSSGHNLNRVISGDFGFKCSWDFICRWLQDDDVFNEMYVRARKRLIDFYADQILEKSESATAENHHALRLEIDTKKWLMAKVYPKVYGDQTAGVTINNNILVIAEDKRAQLMERRKALTGQVQDLKQP